MCIVKQTVMEATSLVKSELKDMEGTRVNTTFAFKQLCVRVHCDTQAIREQATTKVEALGLTVPYILTVPE